MIENLLLIIGNGFDIDLGLNTRYSDFVKSRFYPVKGKVVNTGCYDSDIDFFKSLNLLKYLKYEYNNKKWFDVEISLLEYVKLNTNKENIEKRKDVYNKYEYLCNSEKVKADFNKLRKSLISYLNSISFSEIKKESVSAKLLMSLEKKSVTILSYNYTDLNRIMKELGIKNNKEYLHVHGCLDDESIILGVQDNVEIPENANFIIKSHSEYFRSCDIRGKLEEADHVIFFGHSLGETDYHYFQDFFQKQSGLFGEKPRRKKISFFTYDEDSRQNIISQLRKMNNKRVNYMFDLNDMEFFRTICKKGDNKPIDNIRIEEFLDKLRQDFKFPGISII